MLLPIHIMNGVVNFGITLKMLNLDQLQQLRKEIKESDLLFKEQKLSLIELEILYRTKP